MEGRNHHDHGSQQDGKKEGWMRRGNVPKQGLKALP
jgi:hypothetical protein